MKLLIEYFTEGGAVMWLIGGVSIMAWAMALNTWRRSRHLMTALAGTKDFLQKSDDLNGQSVRRIEEESKITISAEFVRLEKSLGFLGTMASVLPLLGLLGTVLGMLFTFRVIQGHGTGQPSMLAEGIRQALLTTQSGLWAALPVLLFHERISSQMRKATSMAELIFHKLESVRKDRQIK
jgi:biopolymer transport protein ExbB/TolQ